MDRDKKISYVLSQKQIREHECHWPGCSEQVPPARWGCMRHWRMLPKEFRERIWYAYRPGQEITLTPSREYVQVALEIQDFIKSKYNL